MYDGAANTAMYPGDTVDAKTYPDSTNDVGTYDMYCGC